MTGDSNGDKPRLSFEQREGAVSLPKQLALGEISPELRAIVWRMFDGWIKPQYSTMGGTEPWLDDRWKAILHDKWSFRDHQVAAFKNSYKTHIASLREIIATGSYSEFLGLLEWIMRHGLQPEPFNRNIAWALEKARAAYRVVDGDTIMPIADPADALTVERAFVDLRAAELPAPRQHLRRAAQHLTGGFWADSIRESVHAVEATARNLVPGAKELGAALRKLEESARIHKGLKAGFSSIYGFSSDEKGIRHPLIDDNAANVDEIDALFMLGACSSFVSYLIGRGRVAGLLKPIDS